MRLFVSLKDAFVIAFKKAFGYSLNIGFLCVFGAGIHMPDYNNYLMRHGEYGVQSVLEMIEQVEGVRASLAMTLEERWKVLTNARSKSGCRKAA